MNNKNEDKTQNDMQLKNKNKVGNAKLSPKLNNEPNQQVSGEPSQQSIDEPSPNKKDGGEPVGTQNSYLKLWWQLRFKICIQKILQMKEKLKWWMALLVGG